MKKLLLLVLLIIGCEQEPECSAEVFSCFDIGDFYPCVTLWGRLQGICCDQTVRNTGEKRIKSVYHKLTRMEYSDYSYESKDILGSIFEDLLLPIDSIYESMTFFSVHNIGLSSTNHPGPWITPPGAGYGAIYPYGPWAYSDTLYYVDPELTVFEVSQPIVNCE